MIGTGKKIIKILNNNDLINTVKEQLKENKGYGFYIDNQYTESNPLSVLENEKKPLTNNANIKIIDALPKGYGYLFTNNKITPKNINDTLLLEVRFKVKSSIQNGGVSISLNIGGSQNEIIGDSRGLNESAGNEHPILFIMSPFVKETFVANGGEFHIKSTNGNLSIYDIVYKVELLNKG